MKQNRRALADSTDPVRPLSRANGARRLRAALLHVQNSAFFELEKDLIRSKRSLARQDHATSKPRHNLRLRGRRAERSFSLRLGQCSVMTPERGFGGGEFVSSVRRSFRNFWLKGWMLAARTGEFLGPVRCFTPFPKRVLDLTG